VPLEHWQNRNRVYRAMVERLYRAGEESRGDAASKFARDFAWESPRALDARGGQRTYTEDTFYMSYRGEPAYRDGLLENHRWNTSGVYQPQANERPACFLGLNGCP